jgi:iron complex outermembrane receptor protein
VQGDWRGFLRFNYYGEFFEAHLDDGTLPIDAGSEFTIDAEVGYSFNENITIVAGAQNLLDEEPDRNPWDTIVGAKFPVTSPMGFNGGFYYFRGQYNF